MKRFVYKILSICWILLGIFLTILGIIVPNTILSSIFFGIITPIAYLVISIVFCYPFFDNSKYPFIMGLFTQSNINQKIYHSELGTFYLGLNSYGNLTIYKNGFFMLNELFSVDYYNLDLDEAKVKIKTKLDEMYRSKLKDIEVIKSLKRWDGYLDTQGDRNNKLNKIIK